MAEAWDGLDDGMVPMASRDCLAAALLSLPCHCRFPAVSVAAPPRFHCLPMTFGCPSTAFRWRRWRAHSMRKCTSAG